ncbi:MAG: hypothetical protein HY706_01145 [Candidatus Hydrogenedentes bacterium]|nr:hypothetical protein [Candidatus Hydrogenedentota bacterium]
MWSVRVFLCVPLLLTCLTFASYAVPPGFDIFETDSNSQINIGSAPLDPIPADFFAPSSNPFTGIIQIQGNPMPTSPSCPGNIGNADTVVERKQAADVPGVPSSDTIPIEIVALNLVSVAPITVTHSPSGSSTWDVKVEASPVTPSTGMINIQRTSTEGGTFNSTLFVYPKLTFTNTSNPSDVRVFDYGAVPACATLTGGNVPWVFRAPDVVCPACGEDFVPGFDTGSNMLQPFLVQGGNMLMRWQSSCPPPDTDNSALPGLDLLEAQSGASIEFGNAIPPIPAGFFEPGSDPFSGVIPLQGQPLGSYPGCTGDLGPTDTIIERKEPAHLPDIGSTDTIPIELVALSLVSVAPITVTGSSGASQWNVAVQLNPSPPSTGTMTVTKTHANGGTFSSTFTVTPRLIFTRVDNPLVSPIFDPTPDTLNATNVPWVSDSSTLSWPPCTSNFVPGVDSGGKSIVPKSPTSFAMTGSYFSLTSMPPSTSSPPGLPGSSRWSVMLLLTILPFLGLAYLLRRRLVAATKR